MNLTADKVVRLLFVVGVLGAGVLTDTANAGGIGTIKIPIRWCALEGTSAAEAPECACEDSTKLVLQRRHERTSDAVYFPDCNVTWRSAATMQQPTLPVIADPCDPAVDGSCPGVTGDIFFVEALGNLGELNQAFVACYAAWDALGVGSVGLVALNVRRFVNADGTPNLTGGFSGIPAFNNSASQLTEGAFSVTDNDFAWEPVGCNPPVTCESEMPLLNGDPTDQVAGHEGGHSVSLSHVAPPPPTLMLDTAPVFDVLTTGGPGQTSEACPNPVPQPTSQCGRIRLQALCSISGAIVSVPFKSAAVTSLVADEVPLSIGDAAADEIDLALVGLIDDAFATKASFVWRTAGAFPDFATDLSYSFAIDLDLDPATGGSAGSIGFDLPIAGVELVGEVLVIVTRPSPTAPKVFTTSHRLWQHDGMQFNRIDDLASEAADLQGVVDRFPSGEPGFVLFGGRVSHDFDRRFLGGASIVRFQARAEDLVTRDFDLSPEGLLYLIAPQLPVCELSPPTAQPGQQVTLTAGGLTPDQQTVIHLGPEMVATGDTDAVGFTQSTFTVPTLATAGDHRVTLGMQDPDDAITADCVLTVRETAAPGEPFDLRLGRVDTRVVLDWRTPSAVCFSDDYAVYAGNLRALRSTGYDHASRTCSTGGATNFSIDSAGDDAYFLVVNLNATQEGSYGRGADDNERPPGIAACRRDQNIAACR